MSEYWLAAGDLTQRPIELEAEGSLSPSLWGACVFRCVQLLSHRTGAGEEKKDGG